jgi:hypothetical protein
MPGNLAAKRTRRNSLITYAMHGIPHGRRSASTRSPAGQIPITFETIQIYRKVCCYFVQYLRQVSGNPGKARLR